MQFIEMTGKALKRLVSEDELHAGDLSSTGVEDDTIVRINRQGDIEVRRTDPVTVKDVEESLQYEKLK